MTEQPAAPQVNIDPQFTIYASFMSDGVQSWVFNADSINQNDDAFWLVKDGDIVVAAPLSMYVVYRNDMLVSTTEAPISTGTTPSQPTS